MISGPPPGRIAQLFTAWTDWLFAKLSPPAVTQSPRTQPPKLVKSDRDASAAAAAAAPEVKSRSLRAQAR
jgi:hypothetical protein